MSSKRYFGLVLGALALLGCKGGNATGAGGSGTTTGTSVSASNTTGSSKVTSSTTTTTSGTGGGGNHTFATATMVKINDPATGATLTDVKGQDFYSFTAKAGQRLIIEVAPQQQLNAADPTVIDPAFGIYNSAGAAMGSMAMPITYQSGSWPGFSPNTSSIFVQIPKDDTYYVLVADCNGFFMSGCPNPASGVTTLDYAFFVGETGGSGLAAPEQVATSANNSSNPVNVSYKATTTAGVFYDNIIGGAFSGASETHVFKFTPPPTAMHTAGAQDRADFYVQIIGGNQGGDLSASNVKIWAATDPAGTNIISQADQSHFLVDSMHYSPLDFSVPVTLGNTYYLFVQNTHTGGNATTDFYFIDSFLNALYDEAETEPNAGQTTGAQKLTAQGTAKDFYVIDGNIKPVTEADWYSLAVPGGMTKYAFYCDSGRSGSGLTGFTAQLFQADGTTSLGSASETADTDLQYPVPVAGMAWAPQTIPAGQAGATWYLKTTATSQDTMDTGSQYRCTVFFQ